MIFELDTQWGCKHRYTREIPEPAPFLSRHGAQIGGVRVFSVIKIIVVRQVHISPASTAVCGLKINMCKMPHGARRLWTHLFCICFCVCDWQKPKDPQFDPHIMADNQGLSLDFEVARHF